MVLGIYSRLVASIRAGSVALGAGVTAQWSKAREWLAAVEWRLLIPLLGGILLAIVTLAGVLEHQLETNPVPMAALFLGLVGGSAVVAWGLVRVRDGARLATSVITAVVVFIVLGLRGGASEETVGQLTDPATWAFVAAGAVAIWAMILPGISGSFILVLLGMYTPVLAAVNDRNVAILAVFAAGAVVGLALFSQLLHWALQRHYDTVMAALIGLMVGSLRVLWPWPDGVDSTELAAPGEAVAVSAVLAVAAFVAVVAVNALAVRREAVRTAIQSAATSSPHD